MWDVIKINVAFSLYFLCIQRKRVKVNKASPSRQEVKVNGSKVAVPDLEQFAAIGTNQGEVREEKHTPS